MAADTRPYKSKEQDGQGNEVIIRDQQLVEQSTVTTMPSGACFETFDIDGRPVKIPRDNMMSIVLECIGIVLNDSSKNLGTNVNKALGLQGNTIGNISVNDFASVLGALETYISGSGDLNTCKNFGTTYNWGGNVPSNTPFSYGSCFCVQLAFGYIAQIAIERNINNPTTAIRLYYNDNNSWGSWKTYAFTS